MNTIFRTDERHLHCIVLGATQIRISRMQHLRATSRLSADYAQSGANERSGAAGLLPESILKGVNIDWLDGAQRNIGRACDSRTEITMRF